MRKQQPQKQTKILSKVTPNDVLAFAGKAIHEEEQYELGDMDYDMFHQTKSDVDSMINVIAESSDPTKCRAVVLKGVDTSTQYEPPKSGNS